MLLACGVTLAVAEETNQRNLGWYSVISVFEFVILILMLTYAVVLYRVHLQTWCHMLDQSNGKKR